MSARCRALVRAGAVCFVLLGPTEGSSRAEAFEVTLEYEAAAGCPDAAGFKAGVVARLGYDPFRDAAPDKVLVRIAAGEGAFDGRIEWRDRAGNWAGDQSFPTVTTDCVRLARAIGFALAVQIQLLARANAPAPAGSAGPLQTAPAEAPPPVAPPQPAVVNEPANGSQTVPAAAAARSPRDGTRPLFAVGAGPSIGFGVSSDPVALGRLFGRIAWPLVSLELAAEAGLPSTTRRADGAGFSQQLLLAAAAACVAPARWNACLVAKGGQARMAGEDIDRPASAEVIVVEAGARVGFLQPLGRAFVGVHADGLVNLVRWTARLDQVPVWTAPRFAATLGLDAGVSFP